MIIFQLAFELNIHLIFLIREVARITLTETDQNNLYRLSASKTDKTKQKQKTDLSTSISNVPMFQNQWTQLLHKDGGLVVRITCRLPDSALSRRRCCSWGSNGILGAFRGLMFFSIDVLSTIGQCTNDVHFEKAGWSDPRSWLRPYAFLNIQAMPKSDVPV